MAIFKGICTDFVSEIDRLFLSPERPGTRPSLAREREVTRAARIARLRDVKTETVETPSGVSSLWEDF